MSLFSQILLWGFAVIGVLLMLGVIATVIQAFFMWIGKLVYITDNYDRTVSLHGERIADLKYKTKTDFECLYGSVKEIQDIQKKQKVK